MSLTMGKADGVTVVTLTSDPESSCPPLCQILMSLCYSPVLCSVSQHMRRFQRNSLSVLGALHIIDGLLNVGIGVIPSVIWGNTHLYCLGPVFIFLGLMNILSEKYPSICLVTLNVTVNLVGFGIAIAAIVLNSITTANIQRDLSWTCYYSSEYRTLSPIEDFMKKKCEEDTALALMLFRSMTALLIVLAVLELCVAISSVGLGIKALRNCKKTKNKSTDDAEHYQELLREVTSYPTA
ncbi:uncharacterized protein AB9X84_024291 [Acanthopagrus schlegelii]